MQEEFIRGMPIEIPIEFVDTEASPEAPIPLDGCKLVFTIKKLDDNGLTDDNVAFKTTITDHEDPTHGKTTVVIPYEKVKNLVGDYKYDFVLLDSSNTPLFWMKQGLMKFSDNVTKVLVDTEA